MQLAKQVDFKFTYEQQSLFLHRLRMARLDKGFTQDYVASQLGVRQATISDWENGLVMPRLDKVIELSRFYGVSFDYLLSGAYRRI